MKNNPLVSIITVCYNSENFIEGAIKSIMKQNYNNIQYIIIDGKSEDSTIKIIKKYKKIFNIKMKYVSEKDNGIYDAMNKGIKIADGEIIGILNSDDFYINEFVISNVVNKFVENNIECLYADLLFVDSINTNKIVRKWVAGTGNFKFGWNPPHPTTFFLKEVYDKYGFYKSGYKLASDYDFLYRVIYKNKIKTFYLNNYIVKMRVGGKSTSNLKSNIHGSKEIYKTLKENNDTFKIFKIFIRLLLKTKQFF